MAPVTAASIIPTSSRIKITHDSDAPRKVFALLYLRNPHPRYGVELRPLDSTSARTG